ncbi:MAG TPA: PepSY-associated TM helix domain-containing protein, partial [Beijerinckiaceae bacterium]|nr:PepSY-associated TM helix domain-containing protein [Beijerinckiaceae bacterium]
MLKIWYLRLHGWIALIFSLPLLALILTGLILSVEPIMQVSTVKPGSITTEKVLGWLAEHDAEGKARSLSHRPYDHLFSIEGAGPEGEVEIDLRTGKEFADGVDAWYWSDWITWARRTHEHLTVYNVELTVVSTYVMILVILIGILMGLPKIRNNVAGWHKATAWFLLPLVIASPLTGLFITHRISLNF